MNSKTLEYTNGKLQFIGKLYWNEEWEERDEKLAGKRPGVIVFPEAYGLGEHACRRAEQLAQLGYIALAADPHGDGKLYADIPSVGPAIQALYADRADWRSRALAALDALRAHPQVDANKIAAIGFCFGGTTCIELARSGAPLAAIATFHGGLVPELPEDVGRIRAKVLINHGADDPVVKPAAIDAVMNEFRRDKVDWEFIFFGNTVHSFTESSADKRNNPAMAYNPRAEKRSWAAMCNLFDEVFS
jgi:dienelactone hydrolase